MAKSILLILVVALVGGGLLWQRHHQQVVQQEIEDGLRKVRRTFADKAASIVGEDDDAYLSRIQAALRTYDEEVEEVFEGRESYLDRGAYRKRVEAKLEEGEIKEAQASSMLEAYEMVEEAYATLLEGAWKPILTAVGPGDIRLDIYDFDQKQDIDGNPLLEAKAFIWGIQDNTRINWGNLSLRYWYTAPPDEQMRRQLRREGKRDIDEVEQVLGRAEGDATPYIVLQRLSEYVSTFPSYLAVARIRFPAMPREAEKVDIAYSFTAKKGGDSYDQLYEWEQLDVKRQWKLAEGEIWAADEVEASRDEILGRDGDEEEEE